MIVAQHLCKHVNTQAGRLTILEDINLQLASSESLAIVGASGSGKSTLLAILAGLDTPTAGRVLLEGEDLGAMDEERRAALRARYLSFVFQSFQLLPGLTALENVLLPLELKGVADARAQAQTFLAQVGLTERAGHYPPQLSGGEQQRVAVARAFAGRPRLLFADEPTGNLDANTGAHIIDLLFELNQRAGTTLVLVTHEQRLAQRCQHQLQLEAGRVLEMQSC